LHVHEDRVEAMRSLEGLDRGVSVAHDDDGVPAPLEDARGDLLVHRVVLGEEELEAP
jgi:hypothetical protein